MDLAPKIPTELVQVSPKVAPHFQANCDPFGMSDEWEKLLRDEPFAGILKTLFEYNGHAMQKGFFNPKDFQEKKRFSPDDICMQAFLISWEEVLREQGRVIESLGFIDATDLANFGEILRDYTKGNKRTYHNSMVFVFSWFNRLMKQYDSNGFTAGDRFGDFVEMGENARDIKQRIAQDQKAFGSVSAGFNHSSWGRTNLNFDFSKGETKVNCRDHLMSSKQGYLHFSEVLERDRPFEENERLNLLLPTNYRGHVLPLINVTEITLLMNDGTEKKYGRAFKKEEAMKQLASVTREKLEEA